VIFKAAIIGFGRMGITHYAILNTHPEVQIKGVCDTSPLILSNLRRYAPDVAVFDDVRELLAGTPLDFVVVSTPTASHLEITHQAIERGLHVFIEKPLSVGGTGGAALLKAVADRGVVNQIGYYLRFNAIFRAVREHLRAGHIGRPVYYRCEMFGRTVTQPWKGGWRSRPTEGGGCLLDFASHCIDLADFLFGPVEAAFGSFLLRVHSEDVDDAVVTTLRHGSGLSGTLVVNWSDASVRRPYHRVEIVGTRGKIEADRQEVRMFLDHEDAAAGLRAGWTARYLPELSHGTRFDLRGSEFTLQLDHFVDCIAGRCANNDSSFADGLRVDRVINMIRAEHERVAAWTA
jgi:predicted dehydrogenase